MTCPFCGTESTAGAQFCEECGAQLGAPTVASPGIGVAEPMAGLAPGTSLQNGRYTITQALGEGGMGTVLLAKDTRLADKPTVIKVLSVEDSNPEKVEEDVRNFNREAETLAHLDHPLIPDVTDHFEEGLRYYMVMDYVEGENLEDWLDRSKQPMRTEDALRYTLEVLDILEYLSKQQPAIVHRDIKPANLIIGAKDQHVHLVDFGIARATLLTVGQRRRTTALGTPGYAPPEQYQGYADPRSDLYALAATLHHLLTNRDPGEYPPFHFPPIRSLNAKLSPQLEQILEKALMPNAAERYQTPQEMRRDLEATLAGTSILGTTDGYRISGTLPPRVLAPQTPAEPASARRSSSARETPESLAKAGERARRRQQIREPGYSDFETYQSEQASRFEQPHQIFEPQKPRLYPPLPANLYGNSAGDADNQLMWRFIIFIVAICLIGIIAYLLFNSLHF